MPRNCYFTREALDQLSHGFEEIQVKSRALMQAYIEMPFTVPKAREFADHGFARRIITLAECIEGVFTALPPESIDPPTKDQRLVATIHIQAFVFNLFGAVDNLAWIWITERHIRQDNGEQIPNKWVGLRASNHFVRNTFSAQFRNYLSGLDGWFENLEAFRHSLAHRIPLSIPPYAISEGREQEYHNLENLHLSAILRGDFEIAERIKTEQELFHFWRPFMTHSLYEKGVRPIVFHPQLLADFNTVEEIAINMKRELNL